MSARAHPNPAIPTSELDLATLHVFVAVADAGSITGGGRARGLTRSAAGKSIARLETHLGTRLFNRTTRRLSLTADGQQFYDRCIQILHELADAEASIRQEQRQPRGTLRLTVPEIVGRVLVLPFLRSFLEQRPGMEVEMSFTDRIVDVVEEGFDLSIRLGNVPSDSLLIARVIERAHGALFAAPTYLRQHGTPGVPEDLEGHCRLLYGLHPSPDVWSLHGPDANQVTVNAGRRFRFDSGEAVREAAIEGMGIAYLPASLMADDLGAGRLVRVLPDWQGDTLPIQVIYPNRKYLAEKVRQFIDGLVAFRQGH